MNSPDNIWLPVTGKLQIEGYNARILLPFDFILYYQQFINKEFRIFSHRPAHDAHVTVINSKIHQNISKDKFYYAYKTFGKGPIKLEYNPYIHVGGQTKNFKNFYMRVRGEALEQLTRIFGTKDLDNRFHVTIANTKNGVKPYIFY